MAVPKYKSCKMRTRRRRSANMKHTAPNLSTCATCGNSVLPHHVCPKCGSYRGKQILEPEALA